MSTLSEEIKLAYLKLEALLKHVPVNLVTEKRVIFGKSMVSVADLIACQIGWGKLLLRWYQSGIKIRLSKCRENASISGIKKDSQNIFSRSTTTKIFLLNVKFLKTLCNKLQLLSTMSLKWAI